MKKIAVILFFIFSLAQISWGLSSFLSDSASVLAAGEEKADHKNDKGIKDKMDYIFITQISVAFSSLPNMVLRLTEKIYLPPSIEELTPPPNFC